MNRRFPIATFLLLGLFLVSGCRSRQDESKLGRVKVVATFSVLGDLTRNVAGEHGDVTVLVGGDADAHTFEPSPKDVVTLANAGLVVENGVGFETWLDKLYVGSRSKAKRAVATRGLKPRHGDCCHDAKKTDVKPESEDDHEHDPHLWHDVANVMRMVGVIRDELKAVDPSHADAYEANANAYLSQLRELDDWIVQQVASIPVDRRKLVTSHDTFGYFADRYGFQVIGTVLSSFSTEASDPSAAAFAKLRDSIKSANVPAIFAENVQNPRLMQRLADEAGVKLAPPLFTDALSKEGNDGDTYIKMMRHNVGIIVAQLKP